MSPVDNVGWDIIEIKTFRSVFMAVSDTMKAKGSS